MVKKLKLALSILLVASNFAVAPTVLAAASPNPLDKACSTAQAQAGGAICKQAAAQGTTDPIAGPNGLINKAANIIAVIAGIAAVFVIIISGYYFITAGGATPGQRSSDPNKLKVARSSLQGAIIGLVVIALAWSIVKLITNRLIQ